MRKLEAKFQSLPLVGALVLLGYASTAMAQPGRFGNEAQLPRLQPHKVLDAKENLFALSFTTDNSLLVTAGSGGKLTFWNATDAKRIKTVELPTGELCDIVVTPNHQLAAATEDGDLYVYDLQTYNLVSKFATGINFRRMAVRHDEIVTGSEDGVIHVWDLKGDQPISQSQPIHEPITALAVASGGNRISAGTLSGRLAIWESLDKLPHVRAVANQVDMIEFHPNGESLAIGSRSGSIEFRDARLLMPDWRVPIQNDCRRTLAVFSLDGGYIVSTFLDRDQANQEENKPTSRIEIHDTQTHKLAGRLLGQTVAVEAIEVSPDGKFVATATADGAVAIWRSPFDVVDTFHLRIRRKKISDQIERAGQNRLTKVRLYREQAFLNARLKQWKSAANDFQSAQELAPHDTMHWMRAGVMLLLAKDIATYREHAAEMLKRFEFPPNAYAAERAAKLLVLPIEPIGDEETASKLAAFGTRRSGESPWPMYFPTTEALVKYRYGDFDAALELIDISRNRNRPGQNRPDVAQMLNHVIEGLCWAAKGEKQDAREALEKADEYLKPFRIRPASIDDSSQHHWFIGQMLDDEARSLMEQEDLGDEGSTRLEAN